MAWLLLSLADGVTDDEHVDSKLHKCSNSATSIPLHYRDEKNSDLLRQHYKEQQGIFFSSIHINFKITCKSSLL